MSVLSLAEARKLICEKYNGDTAKAKRAILSDAICNAQAAVLVGISAGVNAVSDTIVKNAEEFAANADDIKCDCEADPIKPNNP